MNGWMPPGPGDLPIGHDLAGTYEPPPNPPRAQTPNTGPPPRRVLLCREMDMDKSDSEIDALIERAAEAGATAVLVKIGLNNGDKAARDIRELRDLLAAWRAAKRTAWQTAVRMMTIGFILALLAGLAIKLKLFGGEP